MHLASGCSSYSVFSIQQAPILIANATTSICAGASLQVQALGGVSPYTYNWSNGNTLATGSSTVLGVNTITVTDANNCTISKTFTVHPLPIVTAQGQSVCIGEIAMAQASGANSYTFSNGSIGSTAVYSSPFPATYNQTVIGQNTFGCVGSASFSVYFSACTGINSYSAPEKIVIYPNPSNGEIYFSKVNCKYEIYSAIGQLIGRGNTSQTISNLEAGIYFISIMEPSQIVTTHRVTVVR